MPEMGGSGSQWLRWAARPTAWARNDRGQLPLSLLEAGIGIAVILTVTVGFAYGVPAADGDRQQLDAYALDTGRLLQTEPPQHAESTRLSEVVASEAAFDRERAAMERRVATILPANCLFSVTTPHGRVGYPQPPGERVGQATVTTPAGAVRIRVWYA